MAQIVTVRIERVCTGLDFDAIRDPVAIRVCQQWIGVINDVIGVRAAGTRWDAVDLLGDDPWLSLRVYLNLYILVFSPPACAFHTE